MNQIEALRGIRQLGVASFETRDVSALLRVTPANASMILTRLARSGLVQRLARGRWSMGEAGSRDLLAEQVAAPSLAYVSLQTALFRHGLIDQVPEVIYAATLGRARRVRTPSGTVSLHQIPPRLFGGFAVGKDGAKIASAEKALFDLLYLRPTRSRLFARLPEIEFPKAFQWSEVKRWTDLIAGKSRRSFVIRELELLRGARPS